MDHTNHANHAGGIGEMPMNKSGGMDVSLPVFIINS